MKDTIVILLTALAVFVLILAVLTAQRPTIIETDDYTWKEQKATVIPGFAIGIPTSAVEFQAIRVRVAEVVLKRDVDVSVLVEGKKDAVLLLTVKSPTMGLLMLAVDKRLKDYVHAIAASFGLDDYSPDKTITTGRHIVLLFYGVEE